MGRVAGYEPTRIGVLHERANAVAAHLAAHRTADPAAADAVRTAAAVTAGLEARLLPALARIVGSDALLSWHGTALGRALGTALAVQADGVLVDDFDELRRALAAAATDRDAMLAFVESLGPARLLQLTDRLVHAAPTSAGDELAAALRVALTVAAPVLDDEFAIELVDAAAAARTGRPPSVTAGLALAFLYAGQQLPTSFLVASYQALHAAEVRAARDREQSASDGAGLWIPAWIPPAAGPLAAELRRAAGVTTLADPTVTLDPMYALLRQLAGDGAAGRALFAQPDAAAYVFGGRDVLADGGRAVTAAAAAAAASDGVDATASTATLQDASLVAAGFVNHFGAEHAAALLGRRDDDVSRAVADIVGRHLPSVQAALVPGMGNDGAAVPDMGIVQGSLEVFDPADEPWRAQLRRAELRAIIDLAVDTDGATAALRAHLSAFEVVTANAAAGRLAAGQLGAERSAWLSEQMVDAARFEGQLVEHVGHRAEQRGRDRDRTITTWFDAVGGGTELAVGVFANPLAAAVVTPVVDPLSDALADRFAGHARAAAEESAATQWAWSQQLFYVWACELMRAGVIAPSVPDELVVGATLAPLDELPERLAEVRRRATDPTTATYDLGSVFRALDNAPGLQLDDGALVAAMDAELERHREARD